MHWEFYMPNYPHEIGTFHFLKYESKEMELPPRSNFSQRSLPLLSRVRWLVLDRPAHTQRPSSWPRALFYALPLPPFNLQCSSLESFQIFFFLILQISVKIWLSQRSFSSTSQINQIPPIINLDSTISHTPPQHSSQVQFRISLCWYLISKCQAISSLKVESF